MRTLLITLILLILETSIIVASDNPSGIIYIHPAPDSKDISPETAILFKVRDGDSKLLDEKSMSIRAIGDRSGPHEGIITISGNTVNFKPLIPFEINERVTVVMDLTGFSAKKPYSFAFQIGEFEKYNHDILLSVSDDLKQNPDIEHSMTKSRASTEVRMLNGVAVPGDFPIFEPMMQKSGIAPGKIFLNNWQHNGTPYIMILENDGTPYFYQRVEDRARDFKVQPNGMLTRRFLANIWGFVGMDSSYAIVDTFRCADGYGTDEHELYMLEDGHYFMIALSYHNVDMSDSLSGGHPNALIIENHIQEFDENGTLIFQWDGSDLFDIMDAKYENLRAREIDYIHMNSVAIDYDGHIIASSRQQSAVTKINRQTGDMIWNFGGEKNQFQLLNDADGISYQHFVRPVEGKPNTYLLFDNGNWHFPAFSRAFEFEVDPVNMTATKTWEYRHSPERFTWWMGNAQRLPNGNTFINWADGSLPKATEVTRGGDVIYDANYVDYIHCYRAFRYEWSAVAKRPYLLIEQMPERINLIYNKFGDKNVERYIVLSGKSTHNLNPIDTTSVPFCSLSNLENETYYFFQVYSENADGQKSELSNMERIYVNYREPGEQLLVNGTFDYSLNDWYFATYEGAEAIAFVTNDGECKIDIQYGGTQVWHTQLVQGNIPLIQGRNYAFEFDAYADANRLLYTSLEKNGDPWTNYSKTGATVLERSSKHFSFHFTMTHPTDQQARVSFNFGSSNINVYLDNISVKEVVSSIETRETNEVNSFKLFENYPNPFNAATTIQYHLPEAGYVKLDVFNIRGQRIMTLAEGKYDMGTYRAILDSENLCSGVYFYSLEIKISSKSMVNKQVNKLVVLK